MGDSDPEDEVSDVDAPENWMLVASDAEAVLPLLRESVNTKAQYHRDESQRSVVRRSRWLQRAQNVGVDLRVGHAVS